MSDTVVVSIDLAHSAYQNNGAVILTDIGSVIWADLQTIPLSGVPDPRALALYAANLANSVGADLIFLDGPQGWRDPASDVSELRVCERKLAAPAKTGLPGQVKPKNYTPFVVFSIAVFDALHDLGWKRLQDPTAVASPTSSTAVESFPLAAWRSLQLPPLPAKAKAKAHDLKDRLERLKSLVPFDTDGVPNHDQLQAIVAGLAGFPDRFDIRAEGVAPREIDGTWREGFIVSPRRKSAVGDLPTAPPPAPMFSIQSGRWYAWQMMPGYFAGGYFSPIRVGRFIALKSGKNLVEMSFFNAGYAEGVQGFQIRARVIKRAPDFIVLDLGPNGQEDRVAIVSELSVGWLKQFAPQVAIDESVRDLQAQLTEFYLV